jgi:hypothetical protein
MRVTFRILGASDRFTGGGDTPPLTKRSDRAIRLYLFPPTFDREKGYRFYPLRTHSVRTTPRLYASVLPEIR